MPMRTRCLDLQDDIDADPRNPTGERLWYIDGVEPGHTLDDVIAKVIVDSDAYLTFRVPNSDGFTPAALSGRIYRKRIKPAWVAPGIASAVVTYGVLEAAPHPDIGGENPSKNSDSGGPSGDEILGPEFSFDTTGGTVHITQLDQGGTPQRMKRKTAILNTVDAVELPGLGLADLMGGAIGVSRDHVEGVDINAGPLQWSITIKGVPVTRNYLRYLATLSNPSHLNATRIFDAEPEELLFVGASPRYQPGEGWVVTYNFKQGVIKNNVKIGLKTIQSIAPFDHVWCTYEDSEAGGSHIQQPKAIYVDRIYPLGELSGLFEATG